MFIFLIYNIVTREEYAVTSHGELEVQQALSNRCSQKSQHQWPVGFLVDILYIKNTRSTAPHFCPSFVPQYLPKLTLQLTLTFNLPFQESSKGLLQLRSSGPKSAYIAECH
ncbi:hypothetical protein PCANC_03022 [Puccinia coronata f. sp. avenae]|uniref:Uncharacterized protein n=1 Tax=Puccinia coronata f. sp. avenae TaxID=200324 RepID=A0A2N5SQA2_9BASI|nr:hypothetical protein PCANC_17923 [Puccinia coronata f. sp. avenae]PLW55958.1 hypothetical protein PCANC_03022 [Puccinia coronata f. sp. avenae]